MVRIEPGRVVRDANGTPYSPRYGDVYHSAASGRGQADHVFLSGNGLPQRWAGRRRFTILETGFGLGTNFLATLAAWRRDARRPARLHYFAVEKHPLSREDLRTFLADVEPAIDAKALGDAWPLPLPGTHRREFVDGAVTLTLVFADAERALGTAIVAADAIFLDGFAPDRNPELWTPALMRAVARLAAPGATCATYTVAGPVRAALDAAGFEVEIRPGYARKREMLAGRLRDRPRRRDAPLLTLPEHGDRRAIVVGGGVAGTAIAWRLARRGWRSTVIEKAPTIARGGSSIHAGTFHPLLARDDSRLARLSRAGCLYALEYWRELAWLGHPVAHETCGVLQLARRVEDDGAWCSTPEVLGYPAQFAEAVEAAQADERCGLAIGRPGVWFAGAGWARASALASAQLAAATARSAATLVAATRVAALGHDGRNWSAIGDGGETIARGDIVVLANAADLQRLAPLGALLRTVRGQATYLDAPSDAAPRSVVIGNGYVLPPVDGRVVVGASYDLGSDDPNPSAESDAGNLNRLRALLPGTALGDASRIVGAGVGFRAVAPDRMPVVGPLVPLLPAAAAAGTSAATAPSTGLYALGAFASRGLVWAGVLAETLASMIEGEPSPIESDLAASIAPSRLGRRARRIEGPGNLTAGRPS